MNKLLIATTNPGKLGEIKEFLSDVPVTLVGLTDMGITEAPEETGISFQENAILKAKYYAEKSKLPTLADDGGLEIDALAGEPGVKSHRWIHSDREDTDEEFIQYTLDRMKDIIDVNRGAQLRLVIALVIPGGEVFTSEEKVRGIIPRMASKYRREGFPYRSLLYLPEINKYYNHDELTVTETETYNHRKKALEIIKPILKLKVCSI
ncbi:MAG: non-canonical purine NTP pyrophosphatase [Candidatus Gottesmanbacteria bacterium]|nr:non-canonical purine NTP pyrophosphatase [Candidatus Gottesmanbacteria bacterium]